MKRNPILFLIILGALCLGIALTDLLIQESKTGVMVVDSWSILHLYGKLATIVVVGILVWIIWRYAIRGFFKK